MVKSTFFGIQAAVLCILQLIAAQNPDSADPHPQLTTYKCSSGGGCVGQQTSVVIDWNYHYIHTINGNTKCDPDGWPDSTLCPDEETCAQNCVISGANYASSGVSTSGSALTLHQFLTSNGQTNSVSPRVYLLGSDGNYEMLQLLGQEFRFDVDVSNLPCGQNGALYLSQMDPTGGRSQYNTGGASFGSGYCDAQCPVEAWRNGSVNTNGEGYCCNEMDIWEANSVATQLTPHPCAANGTTCDKSGCGLNPYSEGFHSYYGPGGTVDTTKPLTVITQFITSDGTRNGKLTSINRIYEQDGKTIAAASSTGNTLTSSWCDGQSPTGASLGGLETIGEALKSGMVLVLSIWNDAAQFMNWLDSGNSGPCSSTAGNPATIQQNDPGTYVVFSNIMWGDIGSTGGSSNTPGAPQRRAPPAAHSPPPRRAPRPPRRVR